ncbi:MAG: cupin domain-containing protein [Nocardioides sp.]
MNERLLVANVFDAPLEPDPLADEQIVEGTPAVGVREFGNVGGAEAGIWEIAEGVARDIEADEIFVVLSGSGRVDFADGSTLELGPGAAVRLQAGEQTVWTITERLRKIYLAVG